MNLNPVTLMDDQATPVGTVYNPTGGVDSKGVARLRTNADPIIGAATLSFSGKPVKNNTAKSFDVRTSQPLVTTQVDSNGVETYEVEHSFYAHTVYTIPDTATEAEIRTFKARHESASNETTSPIIHALIVKREYVW